MMKKIDPFPVYYPIERVAKYLRISTDTLKSRVKRGSDIPLRQLGHGQWVVFEEDWKEWLEGTRIAPSDPEVSAFRETL